MVTPAGLNKPYKLDKPRELNEPKPPRFMLNLKLRRMKER